MCIDAGIFREFKTETTFSAKQTKTHWLLEWILDESDNYERFTDEDGRGWMGRLAPLRDGPWQGQDVSMDRAWLVNALRDKMTSIDWRDAAADVARFLKPIEQKSLQLWSERLYLHKLEQLNERLGVK
jgi:hypothetical protein